MLLVIVISGKTKAFDALFCVVEIKSLCQLPRGAAADGVAFDQFVGNHAR
jgi:hypothetical protein